MSLDLQEILGSETGRSAFYKARDNFTAIENEVNSNGEQIDNLDAKQKSQRINISRDATIAGTQTISALSGLPRKITVYAAINGTNKFSIGIYSRNDNKQFCLRELDFQFAYSSADYAVVLHGNNSISSSVRGIISNVTAASFDIVWTIIGSSPPTGSIQLNISIDY